MLFRLSEVFNLVVRKGTDFSPACVSVYFHIKSNYIMAKVSITNIKTFGYTNPDSFLADDL